MPVTPATGPTFFDLLSGGDAHIALFEYPGYGGDAAKPGEAVICEQALALVRQIKERSGGLPVSLMGEPLGTGVATWNYQSVYEFKPLAMKKISCPLRVRVQRRVMHTFHRIFLSTRYTLPERNHLLHISLLKANDRIFQIHDIPVGVYTVSVYPLSFFQDADHMCRAA